MKKLIVIFFIICFTMTMLIESNLCTLCKPNKESCPLYSGQVDSDDTPSCASSCATPCSQVKEVSPRSQDAEIPDQCQGCPSRVPKPRTTPCGKPIPNDTPPATTPCGQPLSPCQQEKVEALCKKNGTGDESENVCASCPLYNSKPLCNKCVLSKLELAFTFKMSQIVKLVIYDTDLSGLTDPPQYSLQNYANINHRGVPPIFSLTVLRC